MTKAAKRYAAQVAEDVIETIVTDCEGDPDIILLVIDEVIVKLKGFKL